MAVETVWRARPGQVLITPVTMEPADKKGTRKTLVKDTHSAADCVVAVSALIIYLKSGPLPGIMAKC